MSIATHSNASNAIKNDIAQECRTFLRWLNFKLNISDKTSITDIKDLCNGMILVELVEHLSQRKIGNKFTKVNSKLRQHHFDRVTLVLNHMQSENVETFHEIGETLGSHSMY